MASFFFSDTGDSLSELSQFLGRDVRRAVHYPPNLYPPGFTVVFSRFRERLHVMTAFCEDVVASAEHARFEQILRDELLADHDGGGQP